MKPALKLLVTGLVTLLALLGAAVPAQATTTQAGAAARWIAAQAPSIDHPSTAADALLALAAAQDRSTIGAVAVLLEVIRTEGAAYAATPDAAAKLAIALDAVGRDPRTFVDGVDLIARVQAGVQPNGAFGGYQGPWPSSLGMIALARAGVEVPASMTTFLLGYQNPDGSFGWDNTGKTHVADTDASALALIGLLAADTPASLAAAEKVVAWAATAQKADGSFAGWNLVNATAIMGASLATAGVDTTKAFAFVAGQQQPSGAFLNGAREDLMATNQAVLLLGGVSYLDVWWDVPALFTDVPVDNLFSFEIEWLAGHGITTGWTTPTGLEYRPLSPINRDAIAAFLYRYAGSPEVTLPASSPFVDVRPDNMYYEEIVWMAQEGISKGWDDNTFRPLEPVNRDAMAAFLYRFAGVTDWQAPATSPFVDLKPTDDFYEEITWLAEVGITTGWDDNTFRPVRPIARDAMAAYLYRLNALVPVQ